MWLITISHFIGENGDTPSTFQHFGHHMFKQTHLPFFVSSSNYAIPCEHFSPGVSSHLLLVWWYNVGPHKYVCWFINPLTIVISTINYRIHQIIHQLSYLGGPTSYDYSFSDNTNNVSTMALCTARVFFLASSGPFSDARCWQICNRSSRIECVPIHTCGCTKLYNLHQVWEVE